jgi:small subunit ribosomal protein S36
VVDLAGQARRLRKVPPLVWCSTALFGCLLVLHSVLSPVSSPTDEHTHADLVLHLATGAGYPDYDQRYVSRAAFYALYVLQPGVLELTPERAAEGEKQQTFAELGGDGPTPDPVLNQMPQHPPAYYVAASSWLRGFRLVASEERSLVTEWHLIRYFNVLVMTPLPLLSWLAARRIGAGSGAAIAASIFPLAVPQLAHIGAAINNDPLLTLLGALLAVLVAGLLNGGPNDRTAIAMGVVTGLALLTKAFAAVFPVWIVMVIAVRGWRHRPERRRLVRQLVIAGSVTVVVGGWWWIVRLLRHGTPSPTIETERLTGDLAPPDFEPELFEFVRRFGAWITRRFWGDFGWFEIQLGLGLVVGATVVSVLTMAVAVAGRSWRRSADDDAVPVASAVAFISVVFLLLAFVFVRALDLYLETSETRFVQGRYLYGGIVPMAVMVGIGLHRLVGRYAASVLLLGAMLLHAESARLMLREWWAEPTASVRRSVVAMVRWNPLPTPLVATVTLATCCLAVLALLYSARHARSGPEEEDLRPITPGYVR